MANIVFSYLEISAIYYSWTKYQELSSNTASNSSVFLTVSFGLDTVANSKDTWYWLSKCIHFNFETKMH